MSEIKTKRSIILNPSRFELVEYERQDWIVTAEIGTELSDLLDPGYWAHVSARMKPYDQIQVRVDDGCWLVNLLVLDCSRNWARVHVLSEHKLTTTDVSQSQADGYSVDWKGPRLKFCVIRKSDNEAVRDGFADKEEAIRWMIEHEKITA